MKHQPFLRIFAQFVWARMPAYLQFYISRIHSRIYEWSVSKWFIIPYALLNYPEGLSYTHEFGSSLGGRSYRNFQDYFTRKIIVPRSITAETIWPCDGLLCELGPVSSFESVLVKGERRTIQSIFGSNFNWDHGAYFANIFLHNSDYHRVHSPVSGEIRQIVKIPGELRFLRPWFYQQPSLPALTNERINIEITSKDDQGHFQSWFLSIVGGPGVSTIELSSDVKLGAFVFAGQELSLFKLGSTCCIVSPSPLRGTIGQKVRMGDSLT